jgi:hydrogenase maturation protease
MRRVVVAGFGNRLRRDDGVGVYVVDTLASRWADRVTFLAGHQPLPEWAATLADSDVAFFVDASVEPVLQPRLRRVAPTPNRRRLDGHALAVQELLALTDTAYGRSPEAYLLELPANDLHFGEGLSARTSRAARRAVRLLDRRLAVLTC